MDYRDKIARIDTLKIQQFDQEPILPAFYANDLRMHLQTAHQFIEKPHSHDFNVVVLFTAGSGIHEIDFQSYDIRPGSIFVLEPGQTHNWRLSADADGYIFFHQNIAAALLHEFPSDTNKLQYIQLSGTVQKSLERLFVEILKEYRSPHLYSSNLLLTLVTQIYIYLIRISSVLPHTTPEPPRSYRFRFAKLLEYVHMHYREHKSPAYYAELMHMSLKNLNRIVQSVAHKSAGDLIIDTILLEAKRQLLFTDKSFSEIALGLGYEDYAYFSRLFKARTEVTPTAFRKRYL